MEHSVEHIRERCSAAMQGISSWMLGSRQDALKLPPAWGAGTGGLGAGLREGSVEEEQRENEGARLVEEKECWEEGRGGGVRGVGEVVTAHIY